MGLDGDFDPTGVVGSTTLPQADVFIGETDKRLYSVQDGLNFKANSWSPGSFFQPVRSLIGRPKASYSFFPLCFFVGRSVQPIHPSLAS